LNWSYILHQVSKFRVTSITDSLFKYGLYILMVGTISASETFKAPLWVTIILFLLGGIFLLIGLTFYIYFAKKNPDYLRSENFQLRKQSIEILGDKDNSLNPNIKEIIYISNPFSKEIGENKKNDLA
jgi:hypothetical protein